MSSPPLRAALSYLRRLTAPAGEPSSIDAELLRYFVDRHDESAFARLLQRHGPAVLGVCRRVLANDTDAEDAFQAVFVVLARRAASVARRESIGSFLYGVAVRVALRARADRTKRRQHERQATTVMPTEPTLETVWSDLRPILDEEVSRLPEKYREALRLCYFDGRSYDEAARALGCSKGTIASRLSRGRERLRTRLQARGLAPTAGLLAAALAGQATPAAVPPSLLTAALQTVVLAGSEAGTLAPRIRYLAEGVGRTMASSKVRVIVALVLSSVVPCVAGIAVFGGMQESSREKAAAGNDPPPAADAKGNATWQACARLGSVGWPYGGAQFSPDGRTLLTRDHASLVKVWDTATWQMRSQYDSRKRYANNFSGYMPFAPDGKVFCIWGSLPDPEKPGQRLSEVTVVETATGQEMAHLSGRLCGFVPDGSALITWRKDTLTFWDPHSFGRKFDIKAAVPLHGSEINFAKDGSLVCVPADGGKGYVWETAKGEECCRPEGYLPLFAPNGKSLITYLPGGSVKLWDVATGRERASWPWIGEGGWQAQFSTDSRYLLIAPGLSIHIKADGSLEPSKGGPVSKFHIHPVDIRVCNANTGAELTRLPGMVRIDGSPRFSPDGKTVAYQRLEPDENDREELVLWDREVGKERTVLRTAEGIRPRMFSPDGNVLFSADATNGNLKLWDAATGQRLPSLPDVIDSSSLEFSPDGRFLTVTAGHDIWNRPVDRLVLQLSDHPLPPPVLRGTPASETPVPAAAPAEEHGGTAAAKAMAGLQKESDLATQTLLSKLQKAGTDEERRLLEKQLTDIHMTHAAQAVRIAQDNSTDPAALEALEFVLRQTSGGYGGTVSKLRDEALALIRAKFLRSPELSRMLLYWLAYQYVDAASEVLVAIAENNPVPAIQGRAAYLLAEALVREAEGARSLRVMPELINVLKLQERSEHLNWLRRADPDALDREATAWYTRIKNKYADVVLPEQDPPVKLGELAERGLFALRHLGIGKIAPEISGEDLDGKSFKLSDYRGKVVVLIFCGNWCGPCRQMNAQKQGLIEKLANKSFALVEVNSDEDREAVKRTMRKEGLTWRSWFDGGQKGPIASHWNVHGWPTIFVLDSAGVIRYKELRDKLLDTAVDNLLQEAYPGAKSLER